jgi:hypothetical protein
VALIPEDRRRHILDGDETGGGHRSGQNAPGKSEFPADWSDERIIDAVKSVADDPRSSRKPLGNGRTQVNGTRDGIGIEVIIGRDGETVVTAHPTNTPRNPRQGIDG